MAERVQSVERAFDILGQLQRRPQTLTDLADTTGLAKSTLNRLLGTLLELGAVSVSGTDARYRVGPTVTAMGGRTSVSLSAVAEPVLARLASTIGESAGLGIRDYFDVLYTVDIEAEASVQVRTWVGERVAMHAVPSGIVLLSGFAEHELVEFLERPLRPFTDRTLVDPTLIRQRIGSFVNHGVIWGRGEFASDINSVAAPIRNGNGEVVAAVYVHGPAYRFPSDQADVCEALVVEAGSIISAAIANVEVITLRDFDSV